MLVCIWFPVPPFRERSGRYFPQEGRPLAREVLRQEAAGAAHRFEGGLTLGPGPSGIATALIFFPLKTNCTYLTVYSWMGGGGIVDTVSKGLLYSNAVTA